MNVITEHYAFGEDGLTVAVGIAVRYSKSLFDDYPEAFHAIVRMTVDEAKKMWQTLGSEYGSFDKAMADGSRLRIECEQYEGFWMEWTDEAGKKVREPFYYGEDGWSDIFAQAVERGIKEALL